MEYRLFLAAFYIIGFGIAFWLFKNFFRGKVRLNNRKIKFFLSFAFICFFIVAALVNNLIMK